MKAYARVILGTAIELTAQESEALYAASERVATSYDHYELVDADRATMRNLGIAIHESQVKLDDLREQLYRAEIPFA